MSKDCTQLIFIGISITDKYFSEILSKGQTDAVSCIQDLIRGNAAVQDQQSSLTSSQLRHVVELLQSLPDMLMELQHVKYKLELLRGAVTSLNMSNRTTPSIDMQTNNNRGGIPQVFGVYSDFKLPREASGVATKETRELCTMVPQVT